MVMSIRYQASCAKCGVKDDSTWAQSGGCFGRDPDVTCKECRDLELEKAVGVIGRAIGGWLAGLMGKGRK